MKQTSILVAIALVTSIVVAHRPAVAAGGSDAITLTPVDDKAACSPTVSTQGTPGKSVELCITKGLFAHDLYEVKIDGTVVVKGIDDATTNGVNGAYGGQSINLTCTPVLSAPENVTDSQIESMRTLDPKATREQLKRQYVLLNTTETGRHCVVRTDSTNFLAVDILFE
ncbi:hypothetical protein VOI32_35980 [Paraburkholderia caribensis]|uniref:Lipoprotein n=2 Tax=Paraburkholderia TaxID=1822464 RepID=B2JXF9_PARP8|nr:MULTISPECIES: hypothetical protein [Paraburkholderia]ACC76317.1 hypothetical protein Bphy_7332 [Paraburkholderia phymatum STM815]MCO4881775.1 hypothetical protein [Paraburkholderia caribensis]PTB24166.1 hypothetical protein C9I56_35360 [Paraburkholderia caribensis]